MISCIRSCSFSIRRFMMSRADTMPGELRNHRLESDTLTDAEDLVALLLENPFSRHGQSRLRSLKAHASMRT